MLKNLKDYEKKEMFNWEIEKLKDVCVNKKFNIDVFWNNFLEILKEYNCSFGYQNKNSQKHGHLKLKHDLKTGVKTLEIKIEKNEIIEAKIYTILHELTHLINNHLKAKELSKKQKEVVADTVALMYVKSYGMYDKLLESKMSKKWDINKYSKMYIYSMVFSKQKEEEMIRQIKNSYNYFINNL